MRHLWSTKWPYEPGAPVGTVTGRNELHHKPQQFAKFPALGEVLPPWDDALDAIGDQDIMVWRSVRAGGDTKTRKSRRTIALPGRCVSVLREHHALVVKLKADAGNAWQENDLVFPTQVGTEADAANVRRAFRKVTAAAGLDPADWTPRELRHSFVSLMSDAGVPIERISKLVGHSGTTVTEEVYRHQIRPVIIEGAEVMDRLFSRNSPEAGEPTPDA